MNNITIHDIARIARVNPSTVSRALRRDPRIRQETRERIETIVRENGYIPNVAARQLADGKTRNIGLLIGSLSNRIELSRAGAMNEIFQKAGYTLLLMLRDREASWLDKLEQKFFDAAVIHPPGLNSLTEEELEQLKNLRIPILFLDQWIPGVDAPVVTSDHRKSIDLLMEQVVKEKPDGALVGFGNDNTVTLERRVWTEKRLGALGIPFIRDPEKLEEFVTEKGIRNLAVFADSPGGLPDLKQKSGNHPPEKIIGAMFDSWELRYPGYYSPIHLCIQGLEESGKVAAEIILNLLNGRKLKQSKFLIPPLGSEKINR